MGYWSAAAGSSGDTWFEPVPYLVNYDTSLYRLGLFGCRLLNDSYAGNCMRIRRERDSEELDIGFYGRHLDVQAIHDFCFNDVGRVAVWYDQADTNSSTNNNRARNIIESAQPYIFENNQVHTSGDSTAPAIRFKDNNYLEIIVEEGTNYDFERTIMLVLRQTSTAVSNNKILRSDSGSSTGNGYFIRLLPTGGEIGVIGDSQTYNYVSANIDSHIVLGAAHRGDAFGNTDLSLAQDSLIIDGDYLTINSAASGVDVIDGGSIYKLGDNDFTGFINESVMYSDYLLDSAGDKERFDAIRGNQYLYYQFQDPLALPSVVANDDTIDAISYPTIVYNPDNHQYQTQTITGFNVPVTLSFTYDSTNCTLYYFVSEVTTTITANQSSPFSALTSIVSGGTINFQYEQNLTLYVEFTSAVSAVDLSIRNVTDGNSLINIATLATAEYVIPANIANYDVFTRTAGHPLTFTVPFDTSAGDLMILLAANDEDSQLIAPFDSSWKILQPTTQPSSFSAAIYWRVATGNENGNLYGVSSSSGASADWMVWLLVIDNLDTSGGNTTATWLDTIGSEVAFGTPEILNGDINISTGGSTEFIFLMGDGGDVYPFQVSSTEIENPWGETIPAERSGFWPDNSGGGISTGWATRDDAPTGASNNITVTTVASDGLGIIRLAFTPAITEP